MSSHPAISRELSGDIADDFSKLKNEVLSWCAEWCAPSGDAGAGGKVWSDFNAHDPGVQIVEVICYALTELAHRARVPVLSLLQNERGGIAWNEVAFFSPPEILPMAPLTAADYQKLLLDRFHQLSQVSFTAGENGHHLIQLHLHEVPDVEGEKVRHLVEELLLQQRNLGERFTVQMASGTPLTGKPLVFASIADRQKNGCSLADILTGPLLVHGAIADEFLPLVNAAGQAPPSSRLLRAPGWKMPQPDSSWLCQDMLEFCPLQQSFPRNYSLGDEELSASATPLRRAQVQQLRGYLLPFEQLMRNYLAQLSHLPSLFSVQPQTQACFVEPVYAVPEVLSLLQGYNDENLPLSREDELSRAEAYRGDLANPYRRQLAELAESPQEFAQRRHRLLDHMLARFGESFPGDAVAIHNKENLLSHLPEFGYLRAAAAASSAISGQPWRESGLETKTALLLQPDSSEERDLETDKFYYLLEHGQLVPPDGADQASETLALSHVLVNWTANPLSQTFKDDVEALIEDHCGAHLLNHFLWCEPGSALQADFLRLHGDWTVNRTAAEPAANLLTWLKGIHP